MSYEKTIWNTGDIITAEKMNHIENGIAEDISDKSLSGVEIIESLNEGDKILINSGGVIKQIDSSLIDFNGGGSTPSMPIVGDGKTRLYVTVASMDRPVIAIYFGCTVAGGVTIDWGDGSATEATTNTARTRYSHSYSAAGDYVIALEVTDGELVLIGGVDDGGERGITQAIANEEEIPYTLSYNCSTLKMVEIGSGVTSIGNYAFAACQALTFVVISSSVTSIGDYAFSYCQALTSVVIPEGVTSIGNGAFSSCKALTSIVIPEGVTSIGENAFNSCYALTSVIIPEGVASIGYYTFNECYALTSIVIPSSVTSISDSAFGYCSSLTAVVIPSSVTRIGEGAFTGCGLPSVIIPASVTSIGDYAFSDCPALASITIPSSITSIKNETFMTCTSLGGIHFLSSTPPALEAGSFDSVPEDCKIYIPMGSLEVYRAATNWSNYVSMLIEE